jgi:cytosine/uracil/thiamine/allantoin permease
LRRRYVGIRAIFDASATGAYAFWAGFNPAAIVAKVLSATAQAPRSTRLNIT